MAQKMKSEKILRINWLPIVVVVLVVILTLYIMYKPTSYKSSEVSNQENSLQLLTTSSPSPIINPSDKALKIASFLVLRATEKEKSEAKQKRGNENMSDTELIKQVAFTYDSDPALMAYAQAGMEQIMARESRSIIENNTDTSALENQIQELESQQNQLQTEKEKLEKYKRDFEFNCIMSGGVPSGTMCL